jgi:hypothetical protein
MKQPFCTTLTFPETRSLLVAAISGEKMLFASNLLQAGSCNTLFFLDNSRASLIAFWKSCLRCSATSPSAPDEESAAVRAPLSPQIF